MKTQILALPEPKKVTLLVGHVDAAEIRRLCRVEKLCKFAIEPTMGKNRVVQTKTWPYKGKFKKYPMKTNHAMLVSYATISDNMLTVHHCTFGSRVVPAPAGMIFASDANGVHLVRISDGMDFHPQTADFFRKDFAKFVRAAMAENFKRRAAQKKAEKIAAKSKIESARIEKIFTRDLSTTRVTLADSRAAGNCVEGSLAFCERKLGISRQEILDGAHLFSLPADYVLRRANGDAEKAIRAIKVAWNRETMVAI